MAEEVGKRREAFGAYYFAVEIDHQRDFFFRSCSGLKAETEVTPLIEGGLNIGSHKLIGHTTFPNIVLKQGFAGPSWRRLWDLKEKCSKGDKRFDGTIIQMGPNGVEAKWQFLKGWIVKWEGPEFDASKNEISIESIEIAHEELKAL